MTAAEIARRANGTVDGNEAASVDAWGFDSRTLGPGSCFVALRDHRDGHDFVRNALHAGASVALVERGFPRPDDLGPGRALVRVDDTLTALQAVARTVRAERADLQVVAVAGSTGKTSTKDLLAAALAPLGAHANAESFNNEFGLPITLCNAPSAARVLVTEMGERLVGDLALLCDIARPDVGVVTNVGLAHAEFLGGHEGTIGVLRELLEALPRDGFAVLNADDAHTPRLAGATPARVVTVGHAREADIRISDMGVDAHLRPSFTIDDVPFTLPLHGAHQATNAALAVAVAHLVFGLSLDDVRIELANAAQGRWRMELLETDDRVTVLNDAYNANPTSMEAALVALSHLTIASTARRIAVLGDMRELGVHHDDAHRTMGECAAALAVDLVVGVGSGGAAIADAAAAKGVDVRTAADADSALELVDALLRPGDVVLVKGSRALGLERVADGVIAARRRTGSSAT
jgi:UDP-N-acetylmuramoyl-tripeptide--D-alanyl-D-alanine ligase